MIELITIIIISCIITLIISIKLAYNIDNLKLIDNNDLIKSSEFTTSIITLIQIINIAIVVLLILEINNVENNNYKISNEIIYTDTVSVIKPNLKIIKKIEHKKNNNFKF